MKKIGSILLLILALHFVAVVAAVGYFVGTGKLNRESAQQIRLALFPQPTTQPSTTQPSGGEAGMPKGDSPLNRLEELLAKQANRPATEQVEFVRAQFDEQLAQLDRRYRDLKALESQVDEGRVELEKDRKQVEKREAAMTAREAEALQQEQDKGFQAEIALYTSMPAAQVKKVFMAMDDAEAAKYLQALPPRTSTKILKEFKNPEETSRMTAILERIRKSSAAAAGSDKGSDTSGQTTGQAPSGRSGQGAGGVPLPGFSGASGGAERAPEANVGATAAR